MSFQKISFLFKNFRTFLSRFSLKHLFFHKFPRIISLLSVFPCFINLFIILCFFLPRFFVTFFALSRFFFFFVFLIHLISLGLEQLKINRMLFAQWLAMSEKIYTYYSHMSKNKWRTVLNGNFWTINEKTRTKITLKSQKNCEFEQATTEKPTEKLKWNWNKQKK